MINAGKQGVSSWKGRVAEDRGEKNGELKEDKELYMTAYYILNNSYLFELYNLIQFLEPYIDFKKSSRFDDIFVLKNDADVTISMC